MKIKNNVLLKVEESDVNIDGKVNIPDGVTQIGRSAFGWCQTLKTVTIPRSVTEIDSCAFCNCKFLEEVTIPNSVKKMGYSIFLGCKSLKEIMIPDSVKKIEEGTFCDCESLEKITIPDNVTKIRESAFWGCESLKEITIPDRVTKIEKSAFGWCKSLKEITIPDRVTHIGNYAFDWCEKLQQITFRNQTYSVKCVDGYCMVVLRKKQMQDITILKCMYFPERKGTVYVAEKDGYATHGKTLREAMKDLQFKMLQDANLDEHIQRIKQQGYMNANDYRLLTGACREGTNHFLQEHGLTWEDTMPVAQVLEITKGQYGSEKFQTAVEQIL